jgi:hypothetical protein
VPEHWPSVQDVEFVNLAVQFPSMLFRAVALFATAVETSPQGFEFVCMLIAGVLSVVQVQSIQTISPPSHASFPMLVVSLSEMVYFWPTLQDGTCVVVVPTHTPFTKFVPGKHE